MSKIPTAKEYRARMLKLEMSSSEIMKGFTKRHVEAALKEAEKETIKYVSKTIIELNMYNKNSILNAYPLENVK